MCSETSGSADANAEIKIRMTNDRAGSGAYRMADSRAALLEAYNKLYAWENIIAQAELDSMESEHSRQTPKKELSSYEATVPAEDELRVEETGTASPGIVRIIGVPGPLKRLKSYLANRHVDWDREAKEPSEDRRLDLEEQRIDIVREQVDVLRGIGFPEVQIREALSKYIFGPLDRLERCTSIELLSDN
jgi:hypothetical protein